MTPITLSSLNTLKQKGEKITMLTCYDATFARLCNNAGVEVLLVGDSLGMVLQGHDSTLPVTTAEVAYHVASVRRGNLGALIVADLPFMANATLEQTLNNSALLMQAGAHVIKIEGAHSQLDAIRLLADRGIPVCAHMGLTPQTVNVLGGYKVQGRGEMQARQMRVDASALAQAGVAMLVLECVPRDLASEIGAGSQTDGQVLVLHDILGVSISGRVPKFVRNFMTDQDSLFGAVQAFVTQVKTGGFPGIEHSFSG